MSDTGGSGATSDEVIAETAAEAAAEAVEASANAERRRWWQLMRFLRREGERRDRSNLINALVTIFSSAIVAFTATWATMSTTDKNINETRRGQRVDALVEQWSVSIADASSAVELIGQRANDLWAYAAAIEQEGVILEEALTNEANKETDYQKVRKDIAFSSAKAGLVSSANTNKCLDKFLSFLDTWQNALNWTRSTLQIPENFDQGVEAVSAQFENQKLLTSAMSTIRLLARTELETGGTDTSAVKCDIKEEEDLWTTLVPSEGAAEG